MNLTGPAQGCVVTVRCSLGALQSAPAASSCTGNAALLRPEGKADEINLQLVLVRREIRKRHRSFPE